VGLRFLARCSLVATGAVAGLTGLAPAGEAVVAPAGVALPQLPISTPPVPVSPPPVSAPTAALPDPAGAGSAVSGVGAGAPSLGPLADARGAAPVSGRAVGVGEVPTSGGGGEGNGGSGRSAGPGTTPTAGAQEQQAGLAVRRALHQFGGCVGALPGSERRVLLLRANPGRSQPRSRAQVARLLGMSVASVRTAETRGVADLRQASQAGACTSESGLATSPAFLTLGAGQPASVAAQTGQPASATRRHLRAVASAALRGEAVPAKPTTTTPAAAHPDPPGSAATRPLPQWLGIGLIAVLAVFLAAVVAFEFSKTTGRRQRTRYRRAIRSAQPMLAPRLGHPERNALVDPMKPAEPRQPRQQLPTHRPGPARRPRRPAHGRRSLRQ
jgi:hypothetical protein